MVSLESGTGACAHACWGMLISRSSTQPSLSLNYFSGDLNETGFLCFFEHCCIRFAVSSWFVLGGGYARSRQIDYFALGGRGWRAVAVLDGGEGAGGHFVAWVCGDFADVEADYSVAGGAVYGDRAGFAGDWRFGDSGGWL